MAHNTNYVGKVQKVQIQKKKVSWLLACIIDENGHDNMREIPEQGAKKQSKEQASVAGSHVHFAASKAM